MYDIFYIGGKSDINYAKLKTRFPTAKQAESVPQAKSRSLTKFLWIVYNDLIVHDEFEFDYVVDQWSEEYTHVFLNGDFYDGIALMPKHSHHGPGELKARFYINKKHVEILASTPDSKNYDMVFISYEEPNADENYAKLLERFPHAKRTHGVKGIHQAHIAAASLCETDMFWIVDGDAVIQDDFYFDYIPEHHNKEAVHVWRSLNPVNGLVYGYGGVKLFPTEKTLTMDTSKPDMTTSISDKFVAMKIVSNTTAFNTDPFNTWKSAFRECAKLSSKVIDRQKDEETNKRLRIWCTYLENEPAFGEYALKGAKAGAAYGTRNVGNIEALKMINDFDWLKEKFDGNI
jgi:hypothetical protein